MLTPFQRLHTFIQDLRTKGVVSDDECTEMSDCLFELTFDQKTYDHEMNARGVDNNTRSLLCASGMHIVTSQTSRPTVIEPQQVLDAVSKQAEALPAAIPASAPSDAAALQELAELDFDTYHFETWQVPTFMFQMISDPSMKLMSRYKILPTMLQNWIQKTCGLYNNNPYHNVRHALCVTQFVYATLTKGCASQFFNFKDVLCLLVAGVGHDVAHPGVTNAFLAKTNNEWAIRYNDNSVLENLHASVIFQVMSEPNHNFLSGLQRYDYELVREKIIRMVLATDMNHHFSMVEQLQSRVGDFRSGNAFLTDTKHDREKQKSSKNDRRLLMEALLHFGDLNNCHRPWRVYKHLVGLLEMEFHAQGDLERQIGLPVSAMMDRSKDNLIAQQTGWISFVIKPLFVELKVILQTASQQWVEQLENNVETNLQNVKSEIAAKEAKEVEDKAAD
mmetsp:Transcript_29132/g.65986  ORF Transcript_29132/g.65986 Transcript_29132/m.65986 type:complete len:447 (+) Transcript_29132:43-1383(+)|eukprot:CAMPEP_0204330998 /NCGR_PEP_ID=MMETSP0469-20131031/15361_1 /ASSEMBLY_ACC=CAM_ASM_000384 /TAXON_ID=2969 /ORGANISM="Oxyrrhis marina" /LENGTH=446 /DNA_ID=CAMNT_0051313915 /DNA_START=35 /DNA_END=1375 /DNA_ORIENTATION=+